jgi:hypothetical protein
MKCAIQNFNVHSWQLLKSSMENEVAELQCKLRKLEEYQVHFD